MHATPETAADHNRAELYSEPSIVELFRASLRGSGVESETPLTFEMIERLWGNAAVVDAVEALQQAHQRIGDTKSAQEDLVAAIQSEILWPVA